MKFWLGFPNAAIYELTATGIVSTEFDNLPAIGLWRRFLNDPQHHYDRLFGDN
jgi:predicted ATPase